MRRSETSEMRTKRCALIRAARGAEWMGGLECRAGSRRRRKIFRRGNVRRVLSMTRTRGAAAAFVDARLGVNLHARGVCFAVIHPTRGVGGMGVRSKWNLMRRLIRSRLRLLLPHQFLFAIVASQTNQLAGANLARAPRYSLGFSARLDATLGPKVRRLRVTCEVRVSM